MMKTKVVLSETTKQRIDWGARIITIITVIISSILAIMLSVVLGALVAMQTMHMDIHTVKGSSMAPTVEDSAIVITRSGIEIKNFDIVTIDYQQDTLLKRVIGVPNDIVTVIDGALFINGQSYDELYLNTEQCKEFQNATFQVVVPDDSYFVLGDNRDNSSDSRTLGVMKAQTIRGVVVATAKE